MSGCASALTIIFAKCSILNVWQCSECVCLGNCSIICTVNLCYVQCQTHSEFSHIQHSAFSGICWNIQSYFALLRHIHAYWDIIKAYSAPCVILAYLFTTLPYSGLFKTLWNADQAYLEPCHKELFSHITAYSEPCATLAYPETWHTRNSGIFRTLP